MSRSRMLREDPDVQQTLKVLQKIHNFGAIPVISSALYEVMEKTGCGAKTYALALMAMYGSTTSGNHYQHWKTEFPQDIYEAWNVLEKARYQRDPVAYIFSSGNTEAQKLALVNFVRDIQEGRYEQLKEQWNGLKILDQVARQLTSINETAVIKKSWRGLPPELVDAYTSGVQGLVGIIPDAAQEDMLQKSVEVLRQAVEMDKKPRPEDIPAVIYPDSKYAKLKEKSKKRFKL